MIAQTVRSITRREAVRTTGVVIGGAILSSSALVVGCSGQGAMRDATPGDGLSADDQSLMEEIADTILPTTPSSPGAKAAGAGAVMTLLLTDCYDAASMDRMRAGLAALRTMCDTRCGGSFTKLSPAERESLIAEVDAEAVQSGESHWFHLMRQLSLQSYFSTEVGLTRALRYVRVPGHWTGCLPLEPGQPAWG